ncbi:hypothetical protein HAX54_051855 [Datura stramonium]|uniref:Uncharacterized protein n=1 Tax=Datura stramonium TaxID=4076 RepID=A0ABS8WRQ8_DATST|nr:hypothetical protein [Datura stramonium]
MLEYDKNSETGKSGTRHLLNKTKNKAIPCPREKVVMIAMNAALEDVYKKGRKEEGRGAWYFAAGPLELVVRRKGEVDGGNICSCERRRRSSRSWRVCGCSQGEERKKGVGGAREYGFSLEMGDKEEGAAADYSYEGGGEW